MLEFGGHQVIEATDGQAGVQMAKAEMPDVILMDISIPIIDGWEATAMLKADAQTRHVPIIALTAHVMASDREKAAEVGCDGFIAKPVEPRTVLDEVNRWLRRQAKPE